MKQGVGEIVVTRFERPFGRLDQREGGPNFLKIKPFEKIEDQDAGN